MKKSTSKPEECVQSSRRFRTTVLVGIFLAIFVLNASSSFAAAPGDVNEDGKLNVVDLQCVVLASLSFDPGDSPGCMVWAGAGDLNCDEGTNIVDVQLIARMSLAKLHGLAGIPWGKDYDHDNVHNSCDVCPHQWDAMQADSDQDGLGDACDPAPQGGEVSGLCDGVECDPSEGWGCVYSSCNEQTGACETSPDGDMCDDNDPCSADWCDYESGECRHDPIDNDDCGESAGLGYGDILVTEFLANPAGIDNGAEYFELYNNTPNPIDLDGMMIHDEGDNSWVINDSIVVAPYGYVTFGSTNADGIRTGVPVDYEYAWGQFTLSNTADEIILLYDGSPVDMLRYDSDYPMTSGNSTALSPDNMQAGSSSGDWCYSGGSPGAANPPCGGYCDAAGPSDSDCSDGLCCD